MIFFHSRWAGVSCQGLKKTGVAGIFAVLLLLMSWTARAQSPYTSVIGRFQVDQVLGCAPFTVNIGATNLKPGHDCTTSTCQMTFEPTVSETSTFTYTYTTPGTYYLRILYQSTVVAPADSILITVLPNTPPDFEMFTCSGNGVTVTITDRIYDLYTLDFGDGTPVLTVNAGINPARQHYYASPGPYNISLHGRKKNAADDCNSNVQTFNAIAVLPAPFVNALTALDPTSLKIDFTEAPNIEMQLEIATNNSGTFQLYQTLFAVSASNLPGLDLTKNYYCFRLNAHDPCTGLNTPSNIICSQKFSATAVSDDDQLTWVTAAGAPDFNVIRDGTPIATVPGSSYDDVSIVCNTPYCYQIVANYADGSISTSLSQCVTSVSKIIPTIINNTSSIVTTEGVELEFVQDPSFSTNQYRIFRRPGTDPFAFLAYSPSTGFTDTTYSTGGGYCYEINYTDACKNDSPTGGIVCPIRLTGTLDKNNTIHLRWNNYKGWKNGVKNYTLTKFDKSGAILKSVAVGLDTIYTDSQPDTVNQVVSYIVNAVANSLLTGSVSNIAAFTKEANLFSPTAFTPDRNNLNETFTVRGFFITRLELRIFNRWGTMIFSTDKNEPWDGTFNGRAQPNDTYVWTARITDTAGQNFSRSGTVMLLTR